MQFTTLSVAFFAALASAHQHAPQHFHHRRGLNATGPSTTLTVYATSIYTITSCAASITDCPARASESTSEMVVTDVIMLTTTVCPVAEAESAASNVLASYSATASLTSAAAGVVKTSTPLGTGVSVKGNAVSETKTAAGVVSSPVVPLSTGVSGAAVVANPSGSDSVVLTYTLGSGTSTTVVTTTIKHVQTSTVYATKSASAAAVAESEAAGVATKGNVASASKTGPTTTIYGTSTSTKYVTVIPAPSAAGGSGVSAAGAVVAGSATGACVPVTVTVALSTVTVTETAAAATSAVVVASAAVAKANVEASTSGDVVVIKSTATVLPVMSTAAPYGNSTVSKTKKKKCSSIFPSSLVSKAKLTGTAPVPLATGA